MKKLADSELIVNKDGSIYHLGLKPEHLFDTLITVGDPERVSSVSKHLDVVYFEMQNREFKTVGGRIGAKEVTIISTGIGTDNIDIVFNELAYLLNFNLTSLEAHSTQRSIDIYRLGTSGSISSQNELDSIVYSQYAISFDDLFRFYNHNFDTLTFDNNQFVITSCSTELAAKFSQWKPSLTLTANGFYGPQFRNSQLTPKYSLQQITTLSYKGNTPGNMEMETAGIYGLAQLLGFRAISINALLANRLTGEFSKNAAKVIDKMIEESLEVICT